MNKISISPISIKEQELTLSPIDPYTHHDNNINEHEKVNNKPSSLVNQQACRDNVKVTYHVVDQNAVSGIFHAEVQAQGIILSLSEDKKYIKLKSTGWFTTNSNLHKWQPYLKKTPIAKGLLLKTGSEFWDSKDNWYLCDTS